MGLGDILRSWRDLGEAAPVLYRSDPDVEISAVAQALSDLLDERLAAFSMVEARRLPAVVRAESLITSTAAMMQPLAYRGGFPVADQPRIVRRPDPFRTRGEFVVQSVLGLIEDGECFWRLGDIDDTTGKPRQAIVLPTSEMDVQWDPLRFLPIYRWRGQRMYADRDLKHIAIGRRAGELRGRGPLGQGLPYLAAVKAAEDYAMSVFTSGGIPATLIQPTGTNDPTEAQAEKIKSRWVASRSKGDATVAVMPKDLSISWPSTDPQKSQMQEARAYGATVVARLLGIPATLLHVETSGATITYTNPVGAIDDLIKSCVLPVYLSPIEEAWSDLVSGPQVVRFDLAEMQRADIAARFALYAQAIPAGFMTAPEARAYEGWSPTETEASHSFDVVPAEVAPQEVPVHA